MATEVVTGELVELPENRTLFQTNDPVEVLAQARQVADELKGALTQGGMIQKIGHNEHVMIDGWQTLGSMLGISPHVVWSRPLPAGHGWEARAEAKTVDGRTVGSAEAMVTREERNWKKAEDYALRSMAQTRAMSKALRGPLGFIITLAGHSATPAEEVAAARTETVETPDWAKPMGDPSMIVAKLVQVLQVAGVEQPGQAVNAIGQTLFNTCDGTVPRIVNVLLDDIVAALPARETEEPPADQPQPET